MIMFSAAMLTATVNGFRAQLDLRVQLVRQVYKDKQEPLEYKDLLEQLDPLVFKGQLDLRVQLVLQDLLEQLGLAQLEQQVQSVIVILQHQQLV
jgi:hypothetical protein